MAPPRLRRDRTAIKVILAALQPLEVHLDQNLIFLRFFHQETSVKKEFLRNIETDTSDATSSGGLSNQVSNANGPMPKLTSSLADAVSALKTLRNIVCVSSASLAKVGGDANGTLARDVLQAPRYGPCGLLRQ